MLAKEATNNVQLVFFAWKNTIQQELATRKQKTAMRDKILRKMVGQVGHGGVIRIMGMGSVSLELELLLVLVCQALVSSPPLLSSPFCSFLPPCFLHLLIVPLVLPFV